MVGLLARRTRPGWSARSPPPTTLVHLPDCPWNELVRQQPVTTHHLDCQPGAPGVAGQPACGAVGSGCARPAQPQPLAHQLACSCSNAGAPGGSGPEGRQASRRRCQGLVRQASQPAARRAGRPAQQPETIPGYTGRICAGGRRPRPSASAWPSAVIVMTPRLRPATVTLLHKLA